MARVLSVQGDEKAVAEILGALSKPEYEVDLATTARVGIAKIMSNYYDVVTLDRTLPDLDGMEILLTMRQVSIETPVLFVGSDERSKRKDRSPEGRRR
jgi:two-component system OmpR family response regulator